MAPGRASTHTDETAGETPDVSIIIVNWNLKDMLRECLDSVRKHKDGLDIELIVVDNASDDGSDEMVAAEFPDAVLLRNQRNEGFARANNQAMQAASGRFFFLLNSDALLREGTLARLTSFLDDHPEAGVCGPRIVNGDGTLQIKSKGYFPTIPRALGQFFIGTTMMKKISRSAGFYRIQDDTGPSPMDWLSGCALLVRREAVEKAGMLDADVFMYCEDMEWCQRIWQAGYKVCYVPEATVTHFGGMSMKRQAGRRVAAHAQGLAAYYSRQHGAVPTLAFKAVLTAGYGLRALGWVLAAPFGRGAGLGKLTRMLSPRKTGSG